MSDAPIEFYSAAWCGDCVRARALLEHYGVDFNYHDIDASDEDKSKSHRNQRAAENSCAAVHGWNLLERALQPPAGEKAH